MMPKFKPVILDEDCAPRRVLELFSVKWTTMVLHSLHFNGTLLAPVTGQIAEPMR
jgi:DNA-binding HxlR family transcriptional regulator